jgi:hypothetical protein
MSRTRRRQIDQCRWRRWSSLRIAREYDLPVSAVIPRLRQSWLTPLSRLEPPRPVVHYEKARPADLVYVNIKKREKLPT